MLLNFSAAIPLSWYQLNGRLHIAAGCDINSFIIYGE